MRDRSIALLTLCLLGCGGTPSDLDASLDAPADAASTLDAGRTLRVASVVDLGALPLPSEATIGRDGASSGVVDGQLLWTFGDTFMTAASPIDGSFVTTATGAWATPDAPLVLEQPVDATGVPAQLIPYTAAEITQNQADAPNGWALWPGAVIDTGAPELLVLFQRIRRSNGSGFDGVGIGTARIAPHQSVARRAPDDLFTRPMPPVAGQGLLYGAGGVATIGDTVYWLACETLACRIARTPRAMADDRTAFEFYDGHAWVADASAAVVVLRNVAGAASLSYDAHLGRYLAVNSQLGTDALVLRTAEHPEGPWPVNGVVVMPSDGGILPAGEGANYLAQEQVALSAPDGRSIVISYARPLGSFRGEVRLARITFQ